MSPSTRSNSKPSSPAVSRATSTEGTPSSTPTRKRPHCKTCKRPLKGHPKGFCPPASPVSTDSEDEDVRLTSGMKSINLGSPIRTNLKGVEEEDKSFVRNRRRKSSTTIPRTDSIQLLSSISEEVVDRLLEPGLMSNTQEHLAKAIPWEAALQNKTRRQVMPCTLIPPTPEGSFIIQPESDSTIKAESPSTTTSPQIESSVPPTRTGSRRPVPRSMSQEEREIFMTTLSADALASMYLVSNKDITKLQEDAKRLNLSSAALMSNGTDSCALFVISSDPSAVRRTAEQVTTHAPEIGTRKGAAIGALLGTLGTWAMLAYA